MHSQPWGSAQGQHYGHEFDHGRYEPLMLDALDNVSLVTAVWYVRFMLHAMTFTA